MQLCVSFIALRSLNGSFQTPQSSQFLNRYLFPLSSMVMMNLWVKTERVLPQVQAAEIGFLQSSQCDAFMCFVQIHSCTVFFSTVSEHTVL